MKRREDLTHEAFKYLYETRHAPFASSFLPEARSYRRSYIQSLTNPTGSGDQPSDIDVVTELEFDSEAAMTAAFARLAEPVAAAALREDEMALFDREAIRVFIVRAECGGAT